MVDVFLKVHLNGYRLHISKFLIVGIVQTIQKTEDVL